MLYLADIYKMIASYLDYELNEEEQKVVRDGVYKETSREYLEKDKLKFFMKEKKMWRKYTKKMAQGFFIDNGDDFDSYDNIVKDLEDGKAIKDIKVGDSTVKAVSTLNFKKYLVTQVLSTEASELTQKEIDSINHFTKYMECSDDGYISCKSIKEMIEHKYDPDPYGTKCEFVWRETMNDDCLIFNTLSNNGRPEFTQEEIKREGKFKRWTNYGPEDLIRHNDPDERIDCD